MRLYSLYRHRYKEATILVYVPEEVTTVAVVDVLEGVYKVVTHYPLYPILIIVVSIYLSNVILSTLTYAKKIRSVRIRRSSSKP